MTIRNGIYTLYRGKEYPISRTDDNGKLMDGYCKLMSMDKIDMENNDFSLYVLPEYTVVNGVEYKLNYEGINIPESYYKIVSPSDVDDVYHINTLAEYKGVTVGVEKENETQYLLFKGYDKYGSLGFDLVAKGEYEKWINKDEVSNVHEVKRPIPDFFED